MIKILLLVLTSTLLVQQGEIPPTTDPTHKGQPAWCQNFDSKEAKHNCDCHPVMGDARCKTPEDPDSDEGIGGESPKCKVYCRKDACMCQRGCTSHLHRHRSTQLAE